MNSDMVNMQTLEPKDLDTTARQSKPAGRSALILAQELLDALWLENLYGFRQHCSVDRPGQLQIFLTLERSLLLPAKWDRSRYRPIRLTTWPIQLAQGNQQTAISELTELVGLLAEAEWWPREVSGARFQEYSLLATQQLEYLLDRESELLAQINSSTAVSLQLWERLSCLRDRPFHPFSHAKTGWTLADEDHYGCFSHLAPKPYWLAVPKRFLLEHTDISLRVSNRPTMVADSGVADSGDAIWRELLNHAEYQQLQTSMKQDQLEENYRPIPIHPWQWQWLDQPTQRVTRPWLQQCVLIGAAGTPLQLGSFAATASLRSLVASNAPQTHLKLSCAVGALGASRTQPPRYLHNGALAQSVLSELLQKDSWLQKHLWLCDEQYWAALLSSGHKPKDQQRTDHGWINEHLSQEVGDISYLLRAYPPSLFAAGYTLIPLSAFAVLSQQGQAPAWQWLINSLQTQHDNPSQLAAQIVGQIASLIVELGYRCLRNGVMPEMHGQNMLLVLGPAADDSAVESPVESAMESAMESAVEIKGLLLRDHDTLRICPALMASSGNPIPPYLINRSTANTLILETPLELFAYFQTLAVQVNLYAMVSSLAAHYRTDERQFWKIISNSLETKLNLLATSPGLEQLIGSELHSPRWPFKSVLAPLLGMKTTGTGMPSDMTSIENPLLNTGIE